MLLTQSAPSYRIGFVQQTAAEGQCGLELAAAETGMEGWWCPSRPRASLPLPAMLPRVPAPSWVSPPDLLEGQRQPTRFGSILLPSLGLLTLIPLILSSLEYLGASLAGLATYSDHV